MKLKKELCDKFPAVLRKKLLCGELELPDAAKFSYEPIYAYRVVEREKDDCREIDRDDFRSYYELKKEPKKPRGAGDITKNPNFYGVSLFSDRKSVEQQMKFPRPSKKMAVGYVTQEGGPQETNKKTKHVCWWLFEDADVTGFCLEE